ncbi:MAG: PepSY domain-containing protein, partial [Muribaculaceae bacterium]|nr:PepSY domain-containing protein [Muribaculaceae bacterium]
MIKLFRKIHLWLSVPFGVIITLVCFSGAMLIFEPEITRAIKSDVYYVSKVSDTPIPMDELLESVKETLPDSVSVTGVTVFADNERTYQVNLSKPRRASLFVDQYTGEITGRYERIGFFSTMFKLHRWLLDSANPHGDGIKVGKLLVGISTLVFVIALISGIVIWWPRAKNNLRKSLSIPFSKGWKGVWKGLHVAGGMYALIILLAMSLTGLTWSFDWYRTAFYAVCGVEHTPRGFG